MKKYFLILAALVLMAIPSGCDKIDRDSGDYIVIKDIKWALAPVPSLLANAADNAPEGFSVPTAAQLKKLSQVFPKYYGNYNGTKGVLFCSGSIVGLSETLTDDDGNVKHGDFNRYSFTDEQMAHGVFLPVNDGWDGYYWGAFEEGRYTYLHFSLTEMKVYKVPMIDAARILTIEGGLLPVKD